MAYQKLQASRLLAVVQSDTINIPDVSHRTAQGSATATTANKLVDSGALFSANGLVKVNDIVYNTTDSTVARVTAIDSDTTLSLSADIMASAEAYKIYRDNNNGCVLYIGGVGDVNVITAGGDDVTLKAVPAGSFIPVQVLRVKDTLTTATDIVAMW